MYVCMYVCMCVYIYIYIYIYAYIYIYINTSVYLWLHTIICDNHYHMYIIYTSCVYLSLSLYIYIYIYLHTYIVYTLCIQHAFLNTYNHISVYFGIYISYAVPCLLLLHRHGIHSIYIYITHIIYVYTYVYMNIETHITSIFARADDASSLRYITLHYMFHAPWRRGLIARRSGHHVTLYRLISYVQVRWGGGLNITLHHQLPVFTVYIANSMYAVARCMNTCNNNIQYDVRCNNIHNHSGFMTNNTNQHT